MIFAVHYFKPFGFISFQYTAYFPHIVGPFGLNHSTMEIKESRLNLGVIRPVSQRSCQQVFNDIKQLQSIENKKFNLRLKANVVASLLVSFSYRKATCCLLCDYRKLPSSIGLMKPPPFRCVQLLPDLHVFVIG